MQINHGHKLGIQYYKNVSSPSIYRFSAIQNKFPIGHVYACVCDT